MRALKQRQVSSDGSRDTVRRSVNVKLRNIAKYARFHWQLSTSLLGDYRDFARSGWANPRNNSQANLRGQLSVYSHALEKGLSHTNLRLPFGSQAMDNLLQVLSQHSVSGLREEERVALAISTGESVVREHVRHGVKMDYQSEKLQQLAGQASEQLLAQSSQMAGVRLESIHRPLLGIEGLAEFVSSRRSVRNFSSDEVDLSLLVEAVAIARDSPSSCNRQPWQVHVASEAATIGKLLELQGGLRGWDRPRMLLVISADGAMYANPYERNAPYVDGGLFAMTLVLALHAQGLATCILNANQPASILSRVRSLLRMDPTELVVCYIAVGHPKDSYRVPCSARVPIRSIIQGERQSRIASAIGEVSRYRDEAEAPIAYPSFDGDTRNT